jgi:hypothetical protein
MLPAMPLRRPISPIEVSPRRQSSISSLPPHVLPSCPSDVADNVVRRHGRRLGFLCCLMRGRLSCDTGATARRAICRAACWGTDRFCLGCHGPLMSVIAPTFSFGVNGYTGPDSHDKTRRRNVHADYDWHRYPERYADASLAATMSQKSSLPQGAEAGQSVLVPRSQRCYDDLRPSGGRALLTGRVWAYWRLCIVCLSVIRRREATSPGFPRLQRPKRGLGRMYSSAKQGPSAALRPASGPLCLKRRSC